MAEGHDGGIVCIGFLPRHSEPVTDVTGVGIRSPCLCLRRPLFFQQRKKRGKETPPKTTFLDFLTRLHMIFTLLKRTTRTLCRANFA